MVKLPMSEYVANYYKGQGIEFTLRQQATLCWNGYHLLKDQLKSLREILEMSDDEKLNTEIRERIEYEEKSYECFLADRPGCIYIFIPDDEDEYYQDSILLKNQNSLMIDITDNFIILDCISPDDGEPDYAHIYPFDLWKVDSWEDQDYWEIVQMVSKMVKAGVMPYNLNYLIQEYMKDHKGDKNE